PNNHAFGPVLHTYQDNANSPFTITATVTDSDGGSGTGSASVVVNNVAPSGVLVTADPATINENGSVTLSGSFTDPGTQDTHTVTIDWGDGSSATTVNLAAGVTSFDGITHQYLDDNPTGTPSDIYTISVTVTDKDGATSAAATAPVTVNNVPP